MYHESNKIPILGVNYVLMYWFLVLPLFKTNSLQIIKENRHAARVKNPGGQVVLGGDNVSPLVEIGLTDPAKSHILQNKKAFLGNE